MSSLQANEDVVWTVDYGDIDVVEVEAELRKQEERKNPQQANERKDAERKAEYERRQAEDARIGEARKQEVEREAVIRSEETKLLQAQQRIADALEEARRTEEAAMFEAARIKAEAKLEADRIKVDAERKQFEDERRKLDEERSRLEAEKKKLEAELHTRATERTTPDLQIPASSQGPPKTAGATPENPPWGVGLEQSSPKKPSSGSMVSPIFPEETSSDQKATPSNENPPAPKSSVPKKPLLGSAFLGE